jgi:hypothetical protein
MVKLINIEWFKCTDLFAGHGGGIGGLFAGAAPGYGSHLNFLSLIHDQWLL